MTLTRSLVGTNNDVTKKFLGLFSGTLIVFEGLVGALGE
jgi:hypothetical protein